MQTWSLYIQMVFRAGLTVGYLYSVRNQINHDMVMILWFVSALEHNFCVLVF